jgi:hypothetical protein
VTASFTPRLDILPVAQRALWPQLHDLPSLGFVLYGGTAVALRIGHRRSIDFDFFTNRPLSVDAIRRALPALDGGTTIQQTPDTLTVLVGDADSPVKVSFFGGIGHGRVGTPATTDDGVLAVAALDDLMVTKVKVILQRIEAKDYRDIAAMLGAGVSLGRGLAGARLLYGNAFPPAESLKAMTYFKGGDLDTLTDEEKRALIEAATAVREFPSVKLASPMLSPA